MSALAQGPSWWAQVTSCNEQAPALPPLPAGSGAEFVIRHREGGPSLWVRFVHDDGHEARMKWAGFWQTAPTGSGIVCRFVDVAWPGSGLARFDLDADHSTHWRIHPDDLAVLRQALDEEREPGELGGRRTAARPRAQAGANPSRKTG